MKLTEEKLFELLGRLYAQVSLTNADLAASQARVKELEAQVAANPADTKGKPQH